MPAEQPATEANVLQHVVEPGHAAFVAACVRKKADIAERAAGRVPRVFHRHAAGHALARQLVEVEGEFAAEVRVEITPVRERSQAVADDAEQAGKRHCTVARASGALEKEADRR